MPFSVSNNIIIIIVIALSYLALHVDLNSIEPGKPKPKTDNNTYKHGVRYCTLYLYTEKQMKEKERRKKNVIYCSTVQQNFHL